jgi:hypothetical protein
MTLFQALKDAGIVKDAPADEEAELAGPLTTATETASESADPVITAS